MAANEMDVYGRVNDLQASQLQQAMYRQQMLMNQRAMQNEDLTNADILANSNYSPEIANPNRNSLYDSSMAQDKTMSYIDSMLQPTQFDFAGANAVAPKQVPAYANGLFNEANLSPQQTLPITVPVGPQAQPAPQAPQSPVQGVVSGMPASALTPNEYSRGPDPTTIPNPQAAPKPRTADSAMYFDKIKEQAVQKKGLYAQKMGEDALAKINYLDPSADITPLVRATMSGFDKLDPEGKNPEVQAQKSRFEGLVGTRLKPVPEKKVPAVKTEPISLTNVSGDDVRRWVADNKDSIEPMTAKSALFEASQLDKMGKGHRANFKAVRDGNTFVGFTANEKTEPKYLVLPQGGPTEGKATNYAKTQIGMASLSKVPAKEYQQNLENVKVALYDKYDGDMDKVNEALNIMTRNANIPSRERTMASSAKAAKNSIEKVLIPAKNAWVKSRGFDADKKILSNGLWDSSKASLLDKSQNQISNFFQSRKLSPEGAAYAAAVFDSIRQINNSVTSRGGAQKSLDEEHRFFAPESSNAQLDKVIQVEQDAVNSAYEAYGPRRLPSADGEKVTPPTKPKPAYKGKNGKLSRVTEIDTDNRKVRLADGTITSY